jgi:hypothetical protein
MSDYQRVIVMVVGHALQQYLVAWLVRGRCSGAAWWEECRASSSCKSWMTVGWEKDGGAHALNHANTSKRWTTDDARMISGPCRHQ